MNIEKIEDEALHLPKDKRAAFIDEFEFTIDLVCGAPKQNQIECEPDIRRASL